jgi:hypothetical protein
MSKRKHPDTVETVYVAVDYGFGIIGKPCKILIPSTILSIEDLLGILKSNMRLRVPSSWEDLELFDGTYEVDIDEPILKLEEKNSSQKSPFLLRKVDYSK